METLKEKSEIKFIKELYRSEFHNNLLDSEYIDLTKKNNFIDEHLHINLVYISEKEEELEIGAYITNNSNRDIQLKNLPICLYKDNIKVFEKIYSINKSVESKQATFIELTIPLILSLKGKGYENIDINFGDGRSIAKYPYVNIDIKELPRINGYKSYREMKKFIKTLPTIRKNELRVDNFKVGEVEDGFCIIALFRNSSNKELNIKSIPLKVYTDTNILVYTGVYNINNNGLKLGGNKGKFYTIVIPFENFFKVDNQDLSKYIVEFK